MGDLALQDPFIDIIFSMINSPVCIETSTHFSMQKLCGNAKYLMMFFFPLGCFYCKQKFIKRSYLPTRHQDRYSFSGLFYNLYFIELRYIGMILFTFVLVIFWCILSYYWKFFGNLLHNSKIILLKPHLYFLDYLVWFGRLIFVFMIPK